MPFKRLTAQELETLAPRTRYITITSGMRGWFAVMMWVNPGEGHISDIFHEPYNSGYGSYPDKDGAIQEAISWAEAEDMFYYIF